MRTSHNPSVVGSIPTGPTSPYFVKFTFGLLNVRVSQPFSASDDMNGHIHNENDGGELVPLRQARR